MYDLQLKKDLLDTIRPQHIVSKPSPVGGWTAAQVDRPGRNAWYRLVDRLCGRATSD